MIKVEAEKKLEIIVFNDQYLFPDSLSKIAQDYNLTIYNSVAHPDIPYLRLNLSKKSYHLAMIDIDPSNLNPTLGPKRIAESIYELKPNLPIIFRIPNCYNTQIYNDIVHELKEVKSVHEIISRDESVEGLTFVIDSSIQSQNALRENFHLN